MSRYDDDGDYRASHSSFHGGRDRSRGRSPSPLRAPLGASPAYMTSATGGSGSPTAQGRLTYDPENPVFAPPPRSSNPDLVARHGSLQVPSSHHRPRSLPPSPSGSGRGRYYDDDDDDDYDRDRDRDNDYSHRARDGSRSPLGKAKHAVHDTFSTSPKGLGAGVIGAIVGGLAAHKASEAAQRARDHSSHGGSGHHHHHQSKNEQRTTLISTIVGAAVGGLGANAIEKRVERKRHNRDDRSQNRDVGELTRRDRSRSRGRDRGVDDSGDESWDDSRSPSPSRSHARGGGRRSNDRNLVISRSPSPTLAPPPPQHGGAADAYYNTAYNTAGVRDGRRDRRGSTGQRGNDNYR
ncbi:hypothetical protein SPI_05875 [Niveomyces insectorum RCEF 264]|uniref:Uncharacterized protein n=1 Tax=Niveomyces insectorum RCEF 264 TaxID=1081102 RepID=A0A167SJE2_9HYPO|nr:hypothetical protein SPI_05875 [Niveomyces insectorum RCEF 264]